MIKFFSRIQKIEQKKHLVRAWKTGQKLETGADEIKTEFREIGWFMLLEGSWESLYVGDVEPEEFKIGDEVEVIIKRKE